jgi:hypothetical protein
MMTRSSADLVSFGGFEVMRRAAMSAIVTAFLLAGCGPTATPTIAPTASPIVTTAPTATPPPTPTTAPTSLVTAAPTPFPTGIPGALDFVRAYEDALIAGKYSQAWTMLGAGSQAGWGTLPAYTSERTAFMKSAGKAYTLTANPSGSLSLTEWLSGTTFGPSIDKVNCVLVKVDWTALAKNNAGWEMWVVNPIPGGWQLYEVR